MGQEVPAVAVAAVALTPAIQQGLVAMADTAAVDFVRL
jgi:hypothetical protein